MSPDSLQRCRGGTLLASQIILVANLGRPASSAVFPSQDGTHGSAWHTNRNLSMSRKNQPTPYLKTRKIDVWKNVEAAYPKVNLVEVSLPSVRASSLVGRELLAIVTGLPCMPFRESLVFHLINISM